MAQSAFAIGADARVFWLDTAGKTRALSDSGFARDIHCGADGTVWVVSTEIGVNGLRVHCLRDFPNNRTRWTRLDAAVSGVQVVGYNREQCIVRGADRSLARADLDGNHDIVSPPGTARHVAALAGRPIYILGATVTDGGCVIRASSDGGRRWITVANGHRARARQVFTQVYGNVVFLDEDGAAGYLDNTAGKRVQFVSPPGSGIDLGIGWSNDWWMVSTEVDDNGGNLVKYWDGESFSGASWHTTETPVTAVKVACG